MGALGTMERSADHVEVMGQCLPMQTCEDYVDVSFMKEERADVVSEAICNTKIGTVRNLLKDRLAAYMVAYYCEEEPAEEDVGESIFEPHGLMGLPMEEREDHWIHDKATATWPWIMVVRRRKLYYPVEEPPPETRG